jgi:flavodoxin
MDVQVVYYTKTGNTKKLADCIAATAGVRAGVIGKDAAVQADILFLGASVYWGGIDGKVKSYINSLSPEYVKEAVVFSTSAIAERGFPEIKKRLEKRGIKVCDENFYCRGEFRSLHKGKPDAEDLAEAARFTKKILAEKKQ